MANEGNVGVVRKVNLIKVSPKSVIQKAFAINPAGFYYQRGCIQMMRKQRIRRQRFNPKIRERSGLGEVQSSRSRYGISIPALE